MELTGKHRITYVPLNSGRPNASQQQVRPSFLPSLFKTSLETSGLVSILQTLWDVLRASSVTAETQVLMKEYLVHLSHVPRFTTVLLFMSPGEKSLVQDVFGALGGPASLHVAERRAWGI